MVGITAAAHGKTSSQVILRWHIQLGALPISKASGPEHLRENLDIFDFALSDDEMFAINALTRPDGRLNHQDPNEYEAF